MVLTVDSQPVVTRFETGVLHLFLYCKGRENFVIGQGFRMHCIKANFDKILHILKEVLGDETLVNGNINRPGPKPKFTDIEVIALSLTAECMGIDSELYLFHKLNSTYATEFPNLISRRQYNDRRKQLFQLQEQLRGKLSTELNIINEVYAIDSMPLEVCKLARMDRNKLGKEQEYTKPDKGFCASHNKYYYGYKLHTVCSPSGVIQALDISRASIHDINYLKDVGHLFQDCIIAGDRGYLNQKLKVELWERSRVCLEVPNRSNQKNKKQVLYVLKKIRKRVETVFSQLCDQFMIQRNYAKSFAGYKTRILAKVSGLTVLQYINKFVRNKPIGQVKYALTY